MEKLEFHFIETNTARFPGVKVSGVVVSLEKTIQVAKKAVEKLLIRYDAASKACQDILIAVKLRFNEVGKEAANA
jgi:hypothetical protein